MSIHQKINAKHNALIYYSHQTPERVLRKNYKQPYQGVYAPMQMENERVYNERLDQLSNRGQ